ncbi:MAG: kynurenine 3-monooxygenase [Alphaproteobacteria bacterium]|nr:kynurenine 3-monooxygenase [Alphaproteobacteria bacterium]
MSSTGRKIHVLGAGLVGPLMAVYLARKGFQVELIERRPDMRKTDIAAGRSINLALTARGIRALKGVRLAEEVMKIAIPMKGRMVHDREGHTQLQPYGQKPEEVIYAVSRGLLNMLLLDAAEKCDGLNITFNRRCAGYDEKTGALTLQDEGTGAQETVETNVVIGADGAWSALRKSMMGAVENFSYAQDFLDYGYKELVIPSAADGGFLMEKHALHIWPHKSFMMIALPNTDGSFTVTLFYPYKGENSFEKLTMEAEVTAFFSEYFPDALPLMPGLTQDFFANPTGALVTVKCRPWHIGGKALLLGDAAHAIVPFFAQGMNSGFEDCAILNAMIEGDNPDWQAVFEKFSAARKPDTDAIADMAVENFTEMRDSVTDPRFLLKKKVGFEIERRWPEKFIPRYSMVIFHDEIPYAEARRRGALQAKLLEKLCADIDSPDDVDWRQAEKLVGEML